MVDLQDEDDDAAVAEASCFGFVSVVFGCVGCGSFALRGVFEEEFAYGEAADVQVFFVAVVALAEDADGVFPLHEVRLGDVLSVRVGFAIDDSGAGSCAA